MRLIDADALKKEWSMGLGSCDDCPQNTRRCQLDMDFTRMDICGMIDDAPTVGGWISVKDHMPERGTLCFVYDGIRICAARYITGNEWVHGLMMSTVTHWMPMIEPPKE